MNDLRKNHKKILCPYCNKKYEVRNLPSHIDTKHPDEIPEGFTPLQITYHLVNKYPFDYRRPCRVCKRPTSWDENKGRYNFLCDDPNCKKKWIVIMKQRIGDSNPTKSEEGLKKMLAARKISGVYKFTTGGELTYTGSYELETLRFMDTVLEIKVEDLMVPGPVLQYQFDNKTHYYISDIYYRPYNLIIEVKDGGNNPNHNQAMIVTRAKQIAKEKFIIDNTDYNYIRLTDKNFSQLMAVFADLKLHAIEYDKSRVIHVNENMFAGIHGMMLPVPRFSESRGDVVIVNYMKKNTFVDDNDYAICNNPKFDTVFARENGKLVKTDKSIFENSEYTPYIVKFVRPIVEGYIQNKLGEYIDKNYLYEAVFNHPAITDDQIMFESTAERYEDYYKNLRSIAESVKEDIYDYSNIIEKRWGIIGDNGVYNCCVKIKGYPKPMRGRSSMIILRKFGKTWKAFLRKNLEEKDYNAPGGGWDENESPKDAAIREAREEVRMNVTRVKHMGCMIEYHTEVKKWVAEHIPKKDWWYGYFSEIFVGLYDSEYKGNIEDVDKDSMIYQAKWYKVDDLLSKESILNNNYKEAISNYLVRLEEE